MTVMIVFYGRPVFSQEESEDAAPETEEAEKPEGETEEASPEAEAEAETEEETAEAETEKIPDEGEAAAEEGAEEPEVAEEPPTTVEAEVEAEVEVEAEAEAEAEAATEAEEAAGVEAGPPEGAAASVTLEDEAKPAKPSPFRNSYFIYDNSFSAYSLNKDAQLTYNPYYSMSYSFRPRYYIWKDIYVGLRWDLEQELTNADDTTKKRQVIWSDVLIDMAWTTAYTIPAVDVILTPKLRIELPASLASQAKTLYLSLGPGFNLTRIFDVWGGIVLQYAFRYTKYFNQYTSALSEKPVLECPENGPCRYDVIGPQNPSMRFTSDFYLEIRPINKLYFSATMEVRNYIRYKTPEAEMDTLGGTITVPTSGKRHSGLMWYIFEVGYDIMPYLTLSIGSSTYNPMLNPESEYYPPFFNRFTNLYLDVGLDLDGIINAIVKKGGAKSKSATDRL